MSVAIQGSVPSSRLSGGSASNSRTLEGTAANAAGSAYSVVSGSPGFSGSGADADGAGGGLGAAHFAGSILTLALSQATRAAGFTTATSNSIQTLTDITATYISVVVARSKAYAELQGRSNLTVEDVARVLGGLEGLKEYANRLGMAVNSSDVDDNVDNTNLVDGNINHMKVNGREVLEDSRGNALKKVKIEKTKDDDDTRIFARSEPGVFPVTPKLLMETKNSSKFTKSTTSSTSTPQKSIITSEKSPSSVSKTLTDFSSNQQQSTANIRAWGKSSLILPTKPSTADVINTIPSPPPDSPRLQRQSHILPPASHLPPFPPSHTTTPQQINSPAPVTSLPFESNTTTHLHSKMKPFETTDQLSPGARYNPSFREDSPSLIHISDATMTAINISASSSKPIQNKNTTFEMVKTVQVPFVIHLDTIYVGPASSTCWMKEVGADEGLGVVVADQTDNSVNPSTSTTRDNTVKLREIQEKENSLQSSSIPNIPSKDKSLSTLSFSQSKENLASEARDKKDAKDVADGKDHKDRKDKSKDRERHSISHSITPVSLSAATLVTSTTKTSPVAVTSSISSQSPSPSPSPSHASSSMTNQPSSSTPAPKIKLKLNLLKKTPSSSSSLSVASTFKSSPLSQAPMTISTTAALVASSDPAPALSNVSDKETSHQPAIPSEPQAEPHHLESAIKPDPEVIVAKSEDQVPPVDTNTSAIEEVIACSCGLNYDDGSFMVACEGCNVWFHGVCVGVFEDSERKFMCVECVSMGV